MRLIAETITRERKFITRIENNHRRHVECEVTITEVNGILKDILIRDEYDNEISMEAKVRINKEIHDLLYATKTIPQDE